ncbi:MAG TPA: hypothetical protein VFG17_01290 [Sphingopyxis sp.]|nr:hypothetical protein [Sphingopyxis sp.]
MRGVERNRKGVGRRFKVDIGLSGIRFVGGQFAFDLPKLEGAKLLGYFSKTRASLRKDGPSQPFMPVWRRSAVPLSGAAGSVHY